MIFKQGNEFNEAGNEKVTQSVTVPVTLNVTISVTQHVTVSVTQIVTDHGSPHEYWAGGNCETRCNADCNASEKHIAYTQHIDYI